MKIAIVGGGFSGLSSAISLLENKQQVVLYEESKKLGGLAAGFNSGKWKWDLECFYHHVFTNDKEIRQLAKKVGWPVLIKNPMTTSLIDKKEVQLDSPFSVLKFAKMSIWGRLRMGVGLAVLKMIPNGLFLEKYRAVEMLPKLIGKEGYQTIWEKLIRAKFGPYSEKVNMSWFWTRVAKRTKRLGYFEGGFQKLIEKIEAKIVGLGGEVRKGQKVKKIVQDTDGKWWVDGEKFDGVILTVPAPVAQKVNLGLELPKIDYLWAQTVVLELNRKLINGYWMNILEKNWPFLVTVEHTNMIDKKNYADHRVVYLGNYLADGNKQLKMSKEELIHLYLPYLRKINKHFKKEWIKKSFLFRRPIAQPVFPINYSASVPKSRTAHKGLYIANMSMVYPYDRGTNYAVMMGKEVAKQLLKDLR